MTFQNCPPAGDCDTTFKAIYLGDVHSSQYIDRFESPFFNNAENAESLTGTTFGSAADPLARNILDITVTGDRNGDGKLEGNNFWGNYDSFRSSKAVEVPDRHTGEVKLVDSFRFDAVSQYKATITYADGTTATARVTVIQDTLGRNFLVPNEDGSGGDAIGAGPIASLELGEPIRDCDNDYNYCPPDDWTPVPCFVSGCRILTATGQRPIERIAAGDRVETADNGAQVVRWHGARRLDAVDLAAHPELRPIRIARGALGAGLPGRDLLVSPQHRMMVRSDIAQKMFGVDEVLVAAKHLLALEGVSVAGDLEEVTYHHILFDRHEIVFAEGAQAESLYTGTEALKAVGPAARAEILALFPELRDGVPAPGARRFLTGREGRNLAAAHRGVALQ